MKSVHDLLREAGIPLLVEDRAVRAQAVRIATLLQRRGCRTIGVLPAGDDVGVPATALQLAVALTQVTDSPAGVVDARGTWFADSRDRVAGGDPDFMLSWVTDGVALLVPGAAVLPGTALLNLRALLRGDVPVRRLVVDLTGFDHRGEHLEAMGMMEGVVVVARAGVTTSRQLERWAQEIPGRLSLGVVLIGT